MIPQTVLALRGSGGVAKERGYDSFVDPVAPAAELKCCKLQYGMDLRAKNTP